MVVVLLVGVVAFVVAAFALAYAIKALGRGIGRATADFLKLQDWEWSSRVGERIDRSARTPIEVGWPALIFAASLLIAMPVIDAVRGSNDDDPPSRPFVDNSPGYVNDDDYPSDDDSGYDDTYIDDDGVDSCVGDCNDMDNDGRTWDDVDADHDGLYETP